MNAPAASPIVPRRLAFEFPEDLQPHWIPGEPELSQMVNGASLTMPYLEPFLIRSIREVLPRIADPRLRADAEAFIAQEGQHFRAHRRYNDLLKQQGYAELAHIEADMEASYARLSKQSLARRLAYTAGFESMTLGLTHWLIGQRRQLFAGADPRVTSFVLWHMVEEAEHKTVAFDVYQAVQGGYFIRALGVLHGSFDVMRFSMRGYQALLRRDGLWRKPRSRLRLAFQLAQFLRHTMPSVLHSLLPWHNPRATREHEWALEWMRRYTAAPAGQPPALIDTSDPAMPVPYAAALEPQP
jgi:predicted metal-dependent hydrolase